MGSGQSSTCPVYTKVKLGRSSVPEASTNKDEHSQQHPYISSQPRSDALEICITIKIYNFTHPYRLLISWETA
jgi:hypothetical protein